MAIFNIFLAAASAFGMMAISHDLAGGMNTESIRDASIVDRLPADHPTGLGAVITPVSVERAKNLNDATLSTFLVDCPPGASAMLHRMPSSGYVLVHVLSGTTRASACHAGVGAYHNGETWVEAAFAYCIASTVPKFAIVVQRNVSNLLIAYVAGSSAAYKWISTHLGRGVATWKQRLCAVLVGRWRESSHG